MSSRDQVIVGGRELDQMLQTLPVKMERNIIRGGLRAGAVVIREEVKQNAPVDEGDLRDSVRVTSRARRGRVSASVKVGNQVAWYAHLVEFGTRPHVIRAKSGSALKFGGVTTAQVNHPGTRPQPFIRPAADKSIPQALTEVTKYIRRRLTNEGLNAGDTAPRDPEE